MTSRKLVTVRDHQAMMQILFVMWFSRYFQIQNYRNYLNFDLSIRIDSANEGMRIDSVKERADS